MSKRCIIITSYLETDIQTNVKTEADDFIICADGGFEHALKENVIPNAIIGDFDSCSFDLLKETIDNDTYFKDTEIIRTQPEKDDTDTLMCVKHGIERGCDNFVLVGGLGGRIDHTIANIQLLSYLLDKGKTCRILDVPNEATMLKGPDQICLEQNHDKYFSIFSFTDQCSGIYVINAKYPLSDVVLTQSNTIGTSNEFVDGSATIKVKKGKLLIIQSSINL